jgi:hypothetical protein
MFQESHELVCLALSSKNGHTTRYFVSEEQFCDLLYIAAKAFCVYSHNTQKDVEIVANDICAMVN